MSNTLQSRIAHALKDEAIKSAELGHVIQATELAIMHAEQTANAERKRAFDPELTPDPVKARAAMEDAEFVVQRLKTMLPRLQRRYQQVAAQESYDAWAGKFDDLLPKHEAAVAKLRAVYPEVLGKLVDALAEARQVDAEVHRVSASKPYDLPQANSDGRSLLSVECTARGLPGISPNFSLMQLKLPAFGEQNQLAWPPFETPLAVQVAVGTAPMVTDPRRHSADWWRCDQERARAVREQQMHEQEQRQSEIDANYRGPRWWEKATS